MEIERDEIRLSSRAADEKTVRRGRRSDASSFRASERDTELLYLVGEQYALTLPQLARLIGRSPHTARALRDRWKRAGWIGSGKLAVSAPPFV
jgi:DNA-binding CsgD family transcriptional regulator